jgi:hypothetical protein
VIEDALGREIVHFAYPFGAVASGGARDGGGGRLSHRLHDPTSAFRAPHDDPLMLQRVPVTGFRLLESISHAAYAREHR